MGLVDYQYAKESSNISFSFFTQLLQDVAKFEAEIRSNKRKLGIFGKDEKKVPQLKFIIEVIKLSL